MIRIDWIVQSKERRVYTDYRNLYLFVKEFYGTMPEARIAAKLGLKRSLIQPRCWVVKMSRTVPEIEEWYLNKKIPRAELNILHVAYNSGVLEEKWAAFKRGELAVNYERRTAPQIRAKMKELGDGAALRALQWVMMDRSEL